jgi:ubiquinol-cytochrome c reductase cytochrome b subunit
LGLQGNLDSFQLYNIGATRITALQALVSLFINFLKNYPVPSNITYFWNLGILSLVCLLLQIITGIFLAMHYVSVYVQLAFDSVEHISGT